MADETLANEVKSPTEKKVPSLENVKCGYLVVINTDDSLDFHVIGKEVGLVQLMGLNQYASKRINMALETSEGLGNTLIANGFNSVLKQLNTILGMLTNQAKSNLQIFHK
jgi:hypothetical protein